MASQSRHNRRVASGLSQGWSEELGQVVIQCPNTGAAVFTGYRMSRALLKTSQFKVGILEICPACSAQHWWQQSEAWVIDEFCSTPPQRFAAQRNRRTALAGGMLTRIIRRIASGAAGRNVTRTKGPPLPERP